jgi:hypothetical protein
MQVDQARRKLSGVARKIAGVRRGELERMKESVSQIERPDFLWHYLLQSFATMGRAAGWKGLIGNKRNYDALRYPVLESLSSDERSEQVRRTCRNAGIRMPEMKAGYILGCFAAIRGMGGPEAARARLLAQHGREGKIRFLKALPGIGDKYARNIMMDVYHEEFRDSIAVDSRIKSISDLLGLEFPTYAEHEAFYLAAAREAGLNGWELDRLLFNFLADFTRELSG